MVARRTFLESLLALPVVARVLERPAVEAAVQAQVPTLVPLESGQLVSMPMDYYLAVRDGRGFICARAGNRGWRKGEVVRGRNKQGGHSVLGVAASDVSPYHYGFLQVRGPATVEVRS